MLTFFRYITSWMPPQLSIPILAVFSISVVIALTRLATFVLAICETVISFLEGFIKL